MCSPVPIKIIGLLVAATLQENHRKCVGKKSNAYKLIKQWLLSMNDAQLRETGAASIHKELGKRVDVALNVYLTHVIFILMMIQWWWWW